MTRILISAGDLSGDLHSGLLAGELRKRHPEWQIDALGGRHLRAAGAHILGDTSNLGVIGFAAALATLPRQLKMRGVFHKALQERRPDAIVMCDWGGFNGRMIPAVQAAGIPLLWYFPPRSWQKHGEGGLYVAKQCDAIATPFPWSANRLREAGGKAEWVGHPLLELAARAQAGPEFRQALDVSPRQKLVALFPGSRPLELKYIAPHIAGAIPLVEQGFAGEEIVWCAAAPAGHGERVSQALGGRVRVVEGQGTELLKACDAAIVKSGTSTLEAAVANAPQVVVYEVPALLHAQVHLTGLRKKIPFVSMPNIIMEQEIVPELLAQDCRAPRIARELLDMLGNPARTANIREAYATVRETLGEQLPYTATHRTADLVEELLLARS